MDAQADSAHVSIAEFSIDDYDLVAALWRRSGLWLRPSDTFEQVALKLACDPGLFLVARIGEALAGTAMGGWDGRRAYVYHLSVDPAWRRRGIGDALMDELEDRFRAKGALKAKLQILAGNDVSRAFFERRGYLEEIRCTNWGKELVAGGAPDDWSPC